MEKGKSMDNEKVVEFDFLVGDQVRIKNNEIIGKIISLWRNRNGNQYEVEYCDRNGAIFSKYFFGDELIEAIV